MDNTIQDPLSDCKNQVSQACLLESDMFCMTRQMQLANGIFFHSIFSRVNKTKRFRSLREDRIKVLINILAIFCL